MARQLIVLAIAILCAPLVIVPALAGAPALPQDDAGSGGDAPDAPEGAPVVAPHVDHTGRVDGAPHDTGDWFAFRAHAGDRVIVRWQHSSTDPGCRERVRAPDGSHAEPECYLMLGRSFTNGAVVDITETGTWFLVFEDRRPLVYAFTFHVEPREDPLPPVTPATEEGPHVVVAVVDTGVNPYHAFLGAPALEQHPSGWLHGFPTDAVSVDLTLNAASYEDAVAADEAEWARVERSRVDPVTGEVDARVHTFPGTRVVGAVSFGEWASFGDTERRGHTAILDERPHGAMAAGLAAGGNLTEAAGNVLVFAVETSPEHYPAAVRWAVQQPFVDAVTISLGTMANAPGYSSMIGVLAEARAVDKPVFVASGNGVTGFGVAADRCLTYTAPQAAAPGATRVGAAAPDTGAPTTWHCVPVDATARTNVPAPAAGTLHEATLFAGTSAATPNLAGHWARLLHDARAHGLDPGRVLTLQHLLNASRPVPPRASPDLPFFDPLQQGHGFVDASALRSARDRLLADAGPTPRPLMEPWMRADALVRETLWGPSTWDAHAPARRAAGEVVDDGNAYVTGVVRDWGQDDAGTRADAPAVREEVPLVLPGRTYTGETRGLFDAVDWFRFEAPDGGTVEVRTMGALTFCVRVANATGDPEGACREDPAAPGVRVVRHDLDGPGPWFLQFKGGLTPERYAFGFAINGPAPDPRWGVLPE